MARTKTEVAPDAERLLGCGGHVQEEGDAAVEEEGPDEPGLGVHEDGHVVDVLQCSRDVGLHRCELLLHM